MLASLIKLLCNKAISEWNKMYFYHAANGFPCNSRLMTYFRFAYKWIKLTEKP
jgi:hypothetical protein